MKVTVDIECTPLEARQFFGQPDVQPMQAAILAEMERRMLAEMGKFSPENLMQTWFTNGTQGADWLTKLVGGMMSKSSDAYRPGESPK